MDDHVDGFEMVLFGLMAVCAAMAILMLFVLISSATSDGPSRFEVECERKGGVVKYLKYEGNVCFRKDAVLLDD